MTGGAAAEGGPARDAGDAAEILVRLKEQKVIFSALVSRQFMQTGLWMGRDVGRILPTISSGGWLVALSIAGFPAVHTASLQDVGGRTKS